MGIYSDFGKIIEKYGVLYTAASLAILFGIGDAVVGAGEVAVGQFVDPTNHEWYMQEGRNDLGNGAIKILIGTVVALMFKRKES
mgnify:CR=1 FL=1